MLANTSPYVILLLGAIIGWILEWLFDLWLFRRNRLEAERRLEAMEAQRAAMESRVNAAELRASDLEQQLSQTTAALAVADAARRADEGAVVVEDVVVEEPAVEEVGDVVLAEDIVEPEASQALAEAEPVSADAWPPGTSPEDDVVLVEAEVVDDELGANATVLPVYSAPEEGAVWASPDEPEAIAVEGEVVEAETTEVPDTGVAPVNPDAWPPAEAKEK